MTSIPYVQFLRPDGRQKEGFFDLQEDLEDELDSLTRCGCRVEAEVLVTGEVSLTISSSDEDIDIEISQNGPEVLENLAKMLRRRRWEAR